MHNFFTGFIQSPDWICFILFVGDLYMEACFTSTHIHIFVVQSTLYSLQCGAYTHKYTLIKQRLNPFQPHWTGSDCVESDSLFRHKVFLKFDLNLDFTVAVMRGFNPDNKQTPKSRIKSNCIKLLHNLYSRGERERLLGSLEREGKLKITFLFYGKGTEIRKRYRKAG